MDEVFEVLIPALIAMVVLNAIIANIFKKAAVLKGYGDEMHIFLIILLFGVVGVLFVLALPDKIQQEQNQKIIELLRSEKEYKNEKM